jgi:NADH oxidase (H2O2-forming)
MKTVIIGSGTGGLFAALTIRKRDSSAEITVIDRKDFELLHPCGLPQAIGGELKDLTCLKGKLPDIRINKMLEHHVERIDTATKKVIAKDLKSEQMIEVGYDKLIIATGGNAFIPKIEGAERLMGKGVFKLATWEDAIHIINTLEGKKTALVAGAGAIGLELAYAMMKQGLEVTVVEAMPRIMPKSFDEDMAGLVQGHLEAMGIKFRLGSRLERVYGSDSLESIEIDGQKQGCNLAILAVGVRGNYDIAMASGLNVGKYGVMVNEMMQTSNPDIYAIGDCVQVRSLIDGRDTAMQLAVAAYKQGVIAGCNIVGQKRTYKGALNTFVIKLGDLEAASTGFTSDDAKEPMAGKAKGSLVPEWCGGKDQIEVKLIASRDGRLQGCQAVGKGAAERVNIASTALQARFTVHDLAETELCYCPAISDTYDVLMQAADNLIRKLEARK